MPVSPEKLSAKEIKIGKWYILHRLGLKRWAVIFLSIIAFVLVGFGLVGLVGHYFFTADIYEELRTALTRSGVNYEAFSQSHEAQFPLIDRVTILSAGDNKYDLVVKVVNANEFWSVASMDYEFFYDGQGMGVELGSLAPSEEKYLVALGIESARQPRQASLELNNLKWRWINDYQEIKSDRSDFEISGLTYTPSRAFDLADRVPISQSSFDLSNNSAYGFWRVPLIILLYRGSNIVGVNQVVLEQLKAGEKRLVELNWYEPLSGVTRVDVRAQPNLLDADNFLAPSGSQRF